MSCPSATFARQYGGLRPPEWLAAKGTSSGFTFKLLLNPFRYKRHNASVYKPTQQNAPTKLYRPNPYNRKICARFHLSTIPGSQLMVKNVLKNMLISWNRYDKMLILGFSNSLHFVLVCHKSWKFSRKINCSDKLVKYFINSRYFTRTKATERLPEIIPFYSFFKEHF